MKQIYPINIDVYNTCLWVFFGSVDECVDAMREQKVEESVIKDWRKQIEECKGCNGLYSYSHEANISLLWMKEFPATIGEYGTLVHEIEHFVFYLFDRIGMEHTTASDEAYAYLMGHVFREIDTYIVEERKEEDKKDV